MPIPEPDADLFEGFLARARPIVTREQWNAEHGAGLALSRDETVALLLALKD